MSDVKEAETTTIAQAEGATGSEIALPDYTPEPATVLDPYTASTEDVAYHLDAMATISLGQRRGDRASVSRDGTIIVHGAEQVPGLVKALEERGGKSLIITFPFDSPNLFVRQRYVYYTATALAAWGDDKQVTVLRGKGKRDVYLKGTPEYEQVVRSCKVATYVYFLLAEWDEDGQPMIVFPDGYGYYRLRTTSRRGARNILGMLSQTARITRGRLAGIPFELYTKIENVATPDGSRFNAPIWGLRMSTPDPKAMRLTSRVFSAIVRAATDEAQALMLEPPRPVDEVALMQDGLLEEETADPTEADLRRLERGFDAAAWRARYYAATNDSPYREPPGRRWLLAVATEGATDSLRALLDMADERLMKRVVAAAEAAAWEYGRLTSEGGQAAYDDPRIVKAALRASKEVIARAPLFEEG